MDCHGEHVSCLISLFIVVIWQFPIAKLVPVAYGIMKLQISCVVVDEKVGTDFLEDSITQLEDHVSIHIVSTLLYQPFLATGSKCGYCCFQQNMNTNLAHIFLILLSLARASYFNAYALITRQRWQQRHRRSWRKA